jgi:hypothetical protein
VVVAFDDQHERRLEAIIDGRLPITLCDPVRISAMLRVLAQS